jgi:hypothetical protein
MLIRVGTIPDITHSFSTKNVDYKHIRSKGQCARNGRALPAGVSYHSASREYTMDAGSNELSL